MIGAEWEAVRNSYHGARRIVYWRLRNAEGHSYGAIGRRTADGSLAKNDAETAEWRALGYGKSTPTDNVELGQFPTRRLAERAVLDYAERWIAS